MKNYKIVINLVRKNAKLDAGIILHKDNKNQLLCQSILFQHVTPMP